MAKVSFNKLGLKFENNIQTIQISEGVEIEVKQYLPFEEKVQLVQRVIDFSMDSTNFENPMKIDLFTNIEIINSYTNITFTEKQKENIIKCYDLLLQSGYLDKIIALIPIEELNIILSYINNTIKSLYTYRNSIGGMLEAISTDYSDTAIDVESLINTLKDPEALKTLKEIAPLVQNN